MKTPVNVSNEDYANFMQSAQELHHRLNEIIEKQPLSIALGVAMQLLDETVAKAQQKTDDVVIARIREFIDIIYNIANSHLEPSTREAMHNFAEAERRKTAEGKA